MAETGGESGYIQSLQNDDVSRDEIAALLDMTTRNVNLLGTQGILPKARNGRYSRIECVHRWIRYLKGRLETGDDETLAKQRTRLTKNKADIAEMEQSRLRGELLPANEVRAGWSQIVAQIKTRLLAIPSKIAARLAVMRTAAECKALVNAEIREALEALATITIADSLDDDAPRRGRGRPRGNGDDQAAA